MVHQRTTTAVRDAYRTADPTDVEAQLAEARSARTWLESLAIDAEVRDWLVEPIGVVEEALAEILRVGSGHADRGEGG